MIEGFSDSCDRRLGRSRSLKNGRFVKPFFVPPSSRFEIHDPILNFHIFNTTTSRRNFWNLFEKATRREGPATKKRRAIRVSTWKYTHEPPLLIFGLYKISPLFFRSYSRFKVRRRGDDEIFQNIHDLPKIRMTTSTVVRSPFGLLYQKQATTPGGPSHLRKDHFCCHNTRLVVTIRTITESKPQ